MSIMQKRVLLIVSKWPSRWCGESQKNAAFVRALVDLNYAIDIYYNNPKQRFISRVISTFISFFRGESARRGFFRIYEYLGVKNYDLVIVSLLQNLPPDSEEAKNLLIDYADFISVTYAKRSEKNTCFTKIFWDLESKRFSLFEKEYLDKVDKVTFASAADCRDYPRCKQLPNPILIKNKHLTAGLNHKSGDDNGRYIFGGKLDVYQNKLSLEILEKISQDQNIKIDIYGAIDNVNTEKYKGLNFLGRVPSIENLLSNYRAFLCPVPVSGGVQNKILEAILLGCPVYSNKEAFERIGLSKEFSKTFDINKFSSSHKLGLEEFNLMIEEKKYVERIYGIKNFKFKLEELIDELG